MPVGARIHDFRQLFRPLTSEQTGAMEWRPADADTSYSIIMGLALPAGPEVTARFDGGATSKSRSVASLAVYGLSGTLELTGGNDMSPLELHHFDYRRDSWTELTVPADGSAPEMDDLVQEDWNLLVRRFVADIRAERNEFYPTFRDGWLASAIIDIVREGSGARTLPVLPEFAA